MKTDELFVDPIGKTVHYWQGGEIPGYATIIKPVKSVNKIFYPSEEDNYISDFGYFTAFLARKPDSTLVIIRPILRYDKKNLIGEHLYIYWEIVFNLNNIKEDDKYVWYKREDLKGFEL